ncbi:YadA-like family protein [Paraburkholderia flagellata]|uniref:YadA-like family protein n=1 Tax=Paraburkholderia flagellata TaxID=2883241 RepID=UPI001F415917|nr:YadA-like family protein [Paraburkholderia flagellata]
MNKTYRSIWNETTGTWVAVQENAVARGKSKSKGEVLVAVTAIGAGVAGLMLPGAAWADMCVSWATNSYMNYVPTTGTVAGCSAWGNTDIIGDTAGKSAYTAIGQGNTQLVVSSTQQVIAFSPGSAGTYIAKMTAGSATNPGVLLSGLAAGVSTQDAVNVSQLKPAVTALGGGASINASTGAVTGPTYTLTNANSITGQPSTTAQTTVGGAFTEVDTALGQLNTTISNINNGGGIKYFHTNSTLADSSATGANSTAIGPVASAAGTDAVALGNGATSVGDGGLAVGASSTAVGDYAVAIGMSSTATAPQATAIGAASLATTSGATAIGSAATATGQDSLSMGSANAVGDYSVALGYGETASGRNSVALGSNSQASGLNSMAFGNTSRANATDSMAFGTLAQVNAAATNSIALGRATSVTSAALNSVALGSSSVADRLNSISVGSANQQRQIIYVAKGTSDTDAVNVSQLKDAVSAFGSGATVGADGSIVAPSYVIGGKTLYNVGDAIDALETAADPTAVHYDDTSFSSVTLGGSGHAAVKLTNVANGGLTASSVDAVNGSQLYALGATTDASGNINNAFVAYDDKSKNKVTLGGSGHAAVTLTNVANGALNASSLDAVNGQQLNATNTNVSNLSGDVTRIKGDITSINGQLADAVIYDTSAHNAVTLGGSGHAAVKLTNVANGALTASSIDAVNGSQLYAMGATTDASGNINNAFVAYDDKSKNKVTLGGSGHAAVALTNVANGALTASSIDAVNGSQLYAMGATTDASGNINNAFVAYDDKSKNKVTLGGSGHAAVALTNVANGALTASSIDAVNGSQLYAMGATTDASGNINNAFVAYDDKSKNKVTLGGSGHAAVALTNVANGALTASSIDAVNGSQLYAMGATTDASGNINNAFVAYDDKSKNKVTLGGSGHAAVALTNVANGALTASSIDAVNGSQLYAMGATTDASGNINNAFVAYDDKSKNKVTLGGSGHAAVALTNVANGALTASSIDAVNGSQLYAMGATTDASGNINNAFVAYDDKSKNKVTLGGSGHAAVTLTNVANGGLTASSVDAVNGSQLYALGATTDASGNINNAFVAYDDKSKNKVTLGGSGHAAVTLTNVANGALTASSIDAVNGSQLYALGATTDASGNINNAFVAYDDKSKNKVTLGGVGTTTPVTLRNVAAGTAPTDAVNVQQLHDTAVNGNPYIGGIGASYNATNAAKATALNAVALGLGSVADQTRTISVGNSATGLTRRITNVQNATGDNDAVNYGQMKTALGISDADTQAALKQSNSQMLAAIQNVDSQLQSVSQQLQATRSLGATSGSAYFQADGAGDGSDNASVEGGEGVAVGAKAVAVGDGGLAVGANSTAVGDYAVAIGMSSTATAPQATAIGAASLATTSGATAIGSAATATGQDSLSMGSANAVGDYSVALGYGETASGRNSVALGSNSQAAGMSSMAFGNTSRANATDSMAFGTLAQVNAAATNSIALGRATSVTSAALNSVALGSSSVADRLNSISVGSANQQRQIIYVAKGTSDTDAVNVSQLKDAVSAFGSGATVGADGSIVAPSYVIGGKTLYNVGDAIDALKDEGGGGNDPMAVHYTDASMSKVSLGEGSTTPVMLTNVANGGLNASSVDAVNGSQLYALGAKTDASGNIENKFVAYDDSSMNSVTLGESMTHAPVALHNVAAGLVNASSFDAVNGTQLYSLANSTADALGGGSTVNDDGSITAPTYNFGGKTFYNAGDAFTSLYGDITDAGGSVDAVKYDSPAHDSVTLGGADHDPVVLTNVANGGLNASSVDAVNGSQLYALGAKTDASGNITNAFVAYDDTSMNAVTLGGTDHVPVVLTNVANGGLNASSVDAVNGSQLYALGAKTDASGNIENKFVAYDDSSMNSVTFGESMAHAPVALHNVAAGLVNASSLDAVNGAQLYGLASQTANALGGGSTVDAKGALVNPTYMISGETYHNVGEAIEALIDGGTSGNDPLAVHYDSAKWNSVTLGGSDHLPVTLTNVANGGLNASSVDAVNGSQLYALGATTDASGNINNAFVTYDDLSKSKITLGGAGSTTPVVLTNVANGMLTASSSDAVNGSQLYALGAKTDASGNLLNAFVAYDDTTMSSVTFGGSGHDPVVLHNVANGVASTDAVNVAQLEAMGANIDSSGNVTNAFVAYDDISKNKVTLGGSGHAQVLITNVKAGSVSASSSDAVNGAQLYATASSTASALGGGSTVRADGSISAPSYAIGGTTFNNVGGALTNLDGRVSKIETSVTNIEGQVANAVQYDSSAHDKITLGGSGTTTAVALTNVANGTLSADSLDAVNGSQLYATNQNVANLTTQIQNINVNGSEYLSTNTTSGAASATGTNSIATGGGAIASGANSTAIGDKAQATGNNSVALGANSVADEDNTVSVGSQGNERRITNVANGVNPTDAANVGQLQSGLNALQSNMNSVARNAYGGVAAATALTMIPDVDQGKTIAVGVGTANFQGYQAVALGASARITQNLKVKLGGGYASGGGATYGGGMSYQW